MSVMRRLNRLAWETKMAETWCEMIDGSQGEIGSALLLCWVMRAG